MTGLIETLDDNVHFSSPVPKGDQSAFARVDTPMYIVDVNETKLVWANPAGLSFLKLPLQECIDPAGNFRTRLPAPFDDPAFGKKLHTYLKQVKEDGPITKSITVLLDKQPVTVFCSISPQSLNSGNPALLVQMIPEVRTKPEQVRSAQVLLYTPSVVAMFDENGKLIFENPASRSNRPDDCDDLIKRLCNSRDFDSLMEELRISGEANIVAL